MTARAEEFTIGHLAAHWEIAAALGDRAQFASSLTRMPSAETVACLARRRLVDDPEAGRDWELLEPEYLRSH